MRFFLSATLTLCQASNRHAETGRHLYLYQKPEYVEGEDNAHGVDLTNIKTRGEVLEGTQEEFDLPEIDSDLPDFLAGEDFSVISGDDDEDFDNEE